MGPIGSPETSFQTTLRRIAQKTEEFVYRIFV
jgi:hypothetical protein